MFLLDYKYIYNNWYPKLSIRNIRIRSMNVISNPSLSVDWFWNTFITMNVPKIAKKEFKIETNKGGLKQ